MFSRKIKRKAGLPSHFQRVWDCRGRGGVIAQGRLLREKPLFVDVEECREGKAAIHGGKDVLPLLQRKASLTEKIFGGRLLTFKVGS